MQITITGKQIDVGDAFRRHAEDKLGEAVGKYFDHGIDAAVVVSREAHLLRADISVHVGRRILVQGQGAGETAYLAFDGACERIAKQLRRYKRRLRDHHQRARRAEAERAAQYVLAAPADEPEDETPPAAHEGGPAIVAETTTEVETLTVGEAVMRMDLADVPALVFRSAANGSINVVYRRPDGNVGWVDAGATGAA